MTICLLSSKLINRIAAGEVIERPASVIKELMENALDAGASNVQIIVEQGGRNLIKVIDNGSGIAQEQIKLALQRHATSKLPSDDLLNIQYMGFRGEALPSIAAISRMKIIARTSDVDVGCCLQVDGGEITEDLAPIAAHVGTVIEVQDLFFSTPNRLKFLKTEKAEGQYIIDLLQKMAMVNFDIQFSLIMDGRSVYQYHRCADYLSRLIEIKGQEFADNSIEVFLERDGVIVRGYAGLPTYNRANSNYLYLFVNKRPVRDNLLIAAVRAAYQDVIPYGRYPIVVLFLEVPYQMVDVNVHPTKAEVRFQDKNLVRNTIIQALKNAIKQGMQRATSATKIVDYFHKSIDGAVPTVLKEKGSIFDFTASSAAMQEKWSNNPSQSASTARLSSISPEDLLMTEPTNLFTAPTASSSLFGSELEEPPLGMARFQLYNSYIISSTAENLIITDQHAAHERLVYERLKLSKKMERQCLLVPEMLEYDPAAIELLMGYADHLSNLGLVMEKMGDKAIIVRETPAILGSVEVKSLMQDVLDTISAFGVALSLEKKLEDIYGTFACHTSIRAGRKLNIDEMDAILRQMESTTLTGQCNHGRPTHVKLRKLDIEKLFERR